MDRSAVWLHWLEPRIVTSHTAVWHKHFLNYRRRLCCGITDDSLHAELPLDFHSFHHQWKRSKHPA